MIEYRRKTATSHEIFSHLKECNNYFLPPLLERVNIQEYADKIFENAVTFEAWADQVLVGCIAAYFNTPICGSAYITNVSIAKNFMRLSIASQLLNLCIDYAMKNNYREIKLEVHKHNNNAICLYRKFGFTQYDTLDDMLLMEIEISYGQDEQLK